MKKNKKAYSAASMIATVFIFWIIAVWISSILNLQMANNYIFYTNIEKRILEKNILEIIEKIDLSSINPWEKFFLSNDWTNIIVSKNENSHKKKTFSLENIYTDYKWNIYYITFTKKEKFENIDVIPEIEIKNI